MMRPRWTVSLALLAAIGCGGDRSSGSGPTRSTASGASAPTTATPVPSGATAAPIASAGLPGPAAIGSPASVPGPSPAPAASPSSAPSPGPAGPATSASPTPSTSPATGASPTPSTSPATGASPTPSASPATSPSPAASPSAPPPAPALRVTQRIPAGTGVVPGERVLARYQLEVSGAHPLELRRLTVTGAGTIDETLFLGGVRAVVDSDADGEVDPGEPQLAALPAPAFPADDGAFSLTLSPPLTVTPGAPGHLLLVFDVLLPTPTRARPLTSMPGEVISLKLVAAGDVEVQGPAGPVPATGRFPVSSVPLYQINDHVLISEVALNGSDYVELFNPTANVVDLSDYYLADYAGPGGGYHQLPSGANFACPRGNDDLLARLPPGASMIPGEVITIALYGAQYQREFFNNEPNYSVYDGVQQWFWDSLHFPIGTPPTWLPLYHGFAGSGPVTTLSRVPVGSFRRQGESIVLFRWDGQSDLVEDVDIVAWGTPAPPADARHDKTGISVDGPDADTTPSSYLPDTPAAAQATLAGPSSGWSQRKALRRVDYLETGERKSGGNGATGHDETSEPWDRTFVLDYCDPGRP